MSTEVEQLKRQFEKKTRVAHYPVVIGDAQGKVYPDPVNRPGMVNVRYQTSAGLSSGLPPVVRCDMVGQLTPGAAAYVGYGLDGDPVLLAPNNAAQIAQGFNPINNNPAALPPVQVTPWIPTRKIIPFSSQPTTPVSTAIAVHSLLWYSGTTANLFTGAQVDFVSVIPTAGNHCLGAYFLKADNTLETVVSTTQTLMEPLDMSDVQELLTAASVGSIPGQAWHLHDAQTTVIDTDFFIDLRKYIDATTFAASAITGIVGVANGGTGTNSLPLSNILIGNGTSSVASLAPGTARNVAVSNGTDWTSRALANADLPGITLQNLVANGGFDFAQRQAPGTLTTIATDKYGPDRWRSSRESASLQYIRNSAIGESGITSLNYGQYKQITNSGKFMVYQILEGTDSQPLLGKTVTWQIKMKASASKTIRMAFIELNTSGTIDTIPATFISAYGANSTDPTLGTNLAYVGTPASKSVTTSWASFSVTATLPSNSKNIILALWTDSQFSANDTLSLAEAGGFVASVAQSWTPEAIGLDLARCQRYYCKTFDVDAAPVQNAGLTTNGCLTMVASSTLGNGIIRWGYPVAMRIAPTITTYNPTQANANWRNTGNTADTNAATLGVGNEGASVYFSAASGDNFYHINASAEAEL